MNLPRWAGVVAVLVAALTLGTAADVRAQDPPDFTDFHDCVAPMDPSIWLGFCSPVWKLPMGAPEIAFSGDLFGGTGLISYDATTQILTVTSKMSGIYFNTHGDNEQLPSDRRMASTVVLRVKIGNDGKLIGGVGDACGDGIWADFCVKGEVHSNTGVVYGATPGSTLVRGRVERATNKPDAIMHSGALHDDFEYYVNITGGEIANAFWLNNAFNHIVLQIFGYNGDHHVTYVGDNPFTQSFTELYMLGYTGVTLNDTGFLFDACNGRIGGTVTDFFNSTTGIPGAEVAMTTQLNLIPSASGAYSSLANLCVGNYTVTVLPPAGSMVYGGVDTQIISVTAGAGGNTVRTDVNFRLYGSAVNTSAYTTFVQAGWGTKPKAQNAGMLLATYFSFLYPSGELEVGVPGTGGFSIVETGAIAVQDFLPQEGKAVKLTADYVDPPSRFKPQHLGKYGHHRKLGSLAGETLALELNVRFSAFGLTRQGLGAQRLATGKLAGMTVDQVLALGNSVLGGGALPSTMTKVDDLEDIIERINKNYQAGTTDNHYLIP